MAKVTLYASVGCGKCSLYFSQLKDKIDIEYVVVETEELQKIGEKFEVMSAPLFVCKKENNTLSEDVFLPNSTIDKMVDMYNQILDAEKNIEIMNGEVQKFRGDIVQKRED